MGNFLWPWRFFSWEIHRDSWPDLVDFPHPSEHQELAATKTQVEDLEGPATGGHFLRRLSWVCLVGDLAYFPNGKSTMTGESMKWICFIFWAPRNSKSKLWQIKLVLDVFLSQLTSLGGPTFAWFDVLHVHIEYCSITLAQWETSAGAKCLSEHIKRNYLQVFMLLFVRRRPRICSLKTRLIEDALKSHMTRGHRLKSAVSRFLQVSWRKQKKLEKLERRTGWDGLDG